MKSFIASIQKAAVLVASFLAVGMESPLFAQAPPQPTGLTVTHNSGQTFLTWNEVASLNDESYRIYRVNNSGPILNVTGLTPIFEVWEGSSELFADRYWLTLPRYVTNCVIVNDGPQLSSTTGLFVATLSNSDFAGGTSGTGYYAVTTVDPVAGENVITVTGAGGNASGGIVESIADPEPVRVGYDPLNTNYPASRIFIQYLDSRKVNTSFFAPNPLNDWWGEDPTQPRIANAKQYACTYKVSVPSPCPAGSLPIVVKLHAHAGNRYPPDYALPSWTPPGGSATALPAIEITPIDVNDTWWFGFSRNLDYRLGVPPASGKIFNFTEARVLRMVWDVLRDANYDSDPERVYVYGHSMGGSGALAFAMRYANVFAAAHASKPMTNYWAWASGPPPAADYRQELLQLWGDPTIANLATAFEGPNGWANHLRPYAGTASRVWDWQNHQYQLGRLAAEDMVPLGVVQALNDNTILAPTQCDPFYAPFAAARQAFGALVNCSGHSGAAMTGMPPTLRTTGTAPALLPFFGLQAIKNEMVPGIGNLVPLPGSPALCSIPSSCLSCPCGGCTGLTYFHDIEWASIWDTWDAAPLESSSGCEISLRTTAASNASYLVDVTPRRLQSFVPALNPSYNWMNVQGGVSVQSGSVTPDVNGDITIPGFLVTPAGNRLIVY